MTESKDDSETIKEPMPEANAKAKTEPQQEVKNKPESKVETKSDKNTNVPSTVTPEIVKQVHEFYEELGRNDVKAVMDMEKTEQKITKLKDKVIKNRKIMS